MSAIQNKTTPTETAQQLARSIWKSLALFCLLALTALPALAQDLGVTQTGAPQPVGAGTNLTYTITVTNSDGLIPATVVTLTDTLPSQVTYVSDTGGCVNNAGVLTCAIGAIPANGSATITIVVSTACNSIGQVTNTAVASEFETDTNPANNTNVLVSTVSDLTKPVITCSLNLTNECTGAGGAAVSYTVTATDNCDPSPTTNCSPASGSTFVIGNTTVNCSSTDASGNSSSCSFLIVVRDTTPPNITTCAPDQTICPNLAGNATVPNFTGGVSASDTCGAVTITQSPLAGSTVSSGTTVITLTVTDSATPPNTSQCTANLIVRTNTSATALASSTNCPGTTATFGPTVPSGTGPFTYSWTKNGTVIPGSNTDTLTISLPVAPSSVVGTNAGTYCVIVQGACTSVTNCATLTIPGLSITCSPNLTNQCTSPSGANVNFTVTATNVCDPTATVACTTNGAPVASGALFGFGTTTVSCTANDVFLNTNTCSFTVLVRDALPPTITTCAPNQTICPTNLAGLAPVPDFTAGVVVSDSCDNWVVTQFPTNGTVVSSGTTNIVLTVVDTSNNTNTCTAQLIVKTNTTATMAALTNCPTTSATFSAVASGTGPFSYSWTSNGVAVSGATSSTFNIPSVVAANAGTYCVLVTGSCNTVTNCTTLSVVAAPTITAQPQPANAPMNNGTVFSVTATDINTTVFPLSYAWKSNGITVPGATASTFAVSNLSLSMNGDTYQVTVTDCAGSTPSAIVTLGVNAISGISFDFNTPGQWTNAPYHVVGNDWQASTLNNQQPFGPVNQYESATGGVIRAGFPRGDGCLDLAFNTGNDQTSILLPVAYDFSYTGAVLNASMMVRLKIPTAFQRTVQMGFLTSSNQNPTTPPLPASLTGIANVGFMSAIFQSTGTGVTNAYAFQTQSKYTNGTATIAQTPINQISNVVNASAPQALKTNNWYRFTAQFINMKQPIIAGTNNNSGSNYLTSATLQDMGFDGATPGPIALAMTNILSTNGDIVNATRLLFGIRGFENGGNDYWDNIFVTTTNGPIFFVQQPTNQVVVQGDYATFNALVNGDGPYTYQWKSNGVPIANAGNWKYITVPQKTANSGDSYTVTVFNVTGGVTNTITSSGATVTVGAKTFGVVSVGSVDGGNVGIRFSRPVDPATAQVPGNYVINPGSIAVTFAKLLVNDDIQQGRTNGTEVLLTPASTISGAFTVTVSGVKSAELETIGSPNDTASGTVSGLIGLDINPVAYGLYNQIATFPGSEFSFAPNSFTVSGGGHDIFGTFDGFRYVYTQKSGDFDVKMRIPYLDPLRTPNKCGFDVRPTLEPFGQSVYAGVNPPLPGLNKVEGTVRSLPFAATASWGNATAVVYPNAWIRLRRVGNTFMRYSSTNGVNWLFDNQTSPFPSFPNTVYVGIAVCANLGTGTLQQPVLAQIDNYGDFAGYGSTNSLAVVGPTNQTAAAGSAITMTAIATVTGGGIPNNGGGEVGFLWQRTNTAAGGWTNMPNAGQTTTAVGATQTSVTNTLSTGNLLFTDNNAQYRVIVSAPGAVSVTGLANLITVTDTAPATVSSSLLAPMSINQLVVNFSEYMSAANALTPTNYIITNGFGATQGVASVSFLLGDPRSVVITTSNALVGGSYFVLVTTNVTDLNGNRMAAGTLRTFAQSAAPTPTLTGPGLQGPIVGEWYTELRSDGSIKDLANLWRYKNYNLLSDGMADFVTYSNVFGINPNAANFPSQGWGDNYGVRMYSYFLAPSNGLYKFYVRADDFAELIMNTNNAAGRDSRLPMDRIVGVGGTTLGTPGPGNVSGGTNTPNNNSVWMVQDNNTNSKYMNLFNSGVGSGYLVTPASGPSVVNGIRFTTADSTNESDPASFTLEGTVGDPRSAATAWTKVAADATGMDGTALAARKTINPDIIFTNSAGAFTNNTFYTSYRVLFPTLRGTNSSGVATAPAFMHIAEVNLLGTNGASLTPVAITPGGAVVQLTMTVNNQAYVVGNSVTNNLTGGQLYYTELRFKETGGGDGASVAIRAGGGLNQTNDVTIPAQAEVISNQFCVFPTNLAPATPVICEIYLQTDSQSPSVPILSAAPSLSTGNGNEGDLIVTTNTPRWVSKIANIVGYEETMAFDTNLLSINATLDNYVGRLYSYFVAPSNGVYRFWMRSDDSSELWMNTNAVNSTDPAGMKLLGNVIAFNSAYTAQAQNVVLIGGQAYWMELRWREGTGGDGVSVAMRAQADGATPPIYEVIPGSFFQYPTNHLHTGPIVSGISPVSPVVNPGDQVMFTATDLAGAGTGLGGGTSGSGTIGSVANLGLVWFKNGTNQLANMVFENVEHYTTPPLTLADDGAVISLLVSNLFSVSIASATIHVAAASAPFVTNAVASQYFDSVVLTFNERVDAYTSQQLANYSISGLQVLSVSRDDWQRNRVILHTSTQTPNTIYTVTVNNVKEASGTLAIAPNSQIQFSSWAFGGSGGVLVEIFTNVLNTLDNFFQNDPKGVFNLPDISYYTNSISDGIFNTDTGNNFYAARISGLFVAPSNGLYRFYVRGDDGSQIWMNTNGPSPAGRVLICRNDGANSASNLLFRVPTNGTVAVTNQLDGFETGVGLGVPGASISPIISLTNGMPYYMEVLAKEGSGGDYVAVALHAVDPNTGYDIGGPGPGAWPNGLNPAIADILPATSFQAPGNPDLTGIATRPNTVTNIIQNRLLTLAVTLKPVGVQGTFQWSKSINNGATFTPISGATSNSYSQYVDLPDEGTIFRVDVAMPGGNPSATTLLHVIPDNDIPSIISAGCIDPGHIGVQFSERVDFSGAHGSAGDVQYYAILDTGLNAFIGVFSKLDLRPNNGTNSVVLTVDQGQSVALIPGSSYVVAALDFADLAGHDIQFDGSPNGTYATFTVMNLFAQDIGTPTPPAVPAAGGYNFTAVPAYPLNPFPETNGGFDVTANGWDIWNTTDGFHFDWLNRPMVGNFDLKVRVQRLDAADQWSKAGLMIRGSTNQNARWIYVINTPTNTPVAGQVPNNFSSFQWRDFDGAGSAPNLGNINGVPPVAYPNAWVRLQRIGNVFNGYQSSNNVDWVLIGSRDTAASGYPFPESMVFGLCTVSHDNIVADNISRNTYAEYRELNIPNELPTITAQPGPAAITNVVHTSVSYSVTATNPANSGPLVYQWMKNGIAISNATSSTLTLSDLKVTDSGTYWVTPANNGGGTPSVQLVLMVTNILPTVVPESLTATQGMTYTFSTASLLGNDFDPDTDTLTLVSVSGVGLNAPQVGTNFNQGLLTGSTLYGVLGTTNALYVPTGGAGGSGGVQLNGGTVNTAGSYIIDELTPGNPVNSFIVSFNLRIGDGSAEPADGMSFNFAPDLPNTSTSPLAAEQGAGTGFTFAVDDYRFLPVPTIGAGAATANGGTANTSGMKIIYHGNNVAVQQCPTWALNATFVPVTITVSDSGVATVTVSGTNVFGSVPLPGYVPTTGRFGWYGRTGNASESHTIDDLSITLNPHQQTALGGSISLNNGIVTYIAPTNACGPDTFFYTISDGQAGGQVVDHVSIVVYPTNNTAPIIASCPTNRTVAVGATCQAALPDVTGDLIVVDQCSGVIKSQSPAAGTMSGLGTTLVTLTASNIVGSNVTCQMYVTNADLTAPSITCPADIVAECTGNGANVSYSVSSSDNCSSPIVNCTPVPSGGHFPLGTNTVNCTSTDAAGNVSSCSFKVIVLDTVAPSLTCPNVVAQCTGPSGANVSFTPSVVEACDPSPAVVCTPASGSAFAFGATPVHCTATDATGNVGSCDFTVTVRDTVAPAFVCPANQTNECTGAGGAVGTYTTPSATDTCDPSPTVSCSPASGTTFAIGTNTVTCIAYDVSLNTNTCTFKIVVRDTTPPSITCVANKTIECGTPWTFDAPTAGDTCGTPVVTSTTVTNLHCGNTLDATRTWVATDAAGNTANCSQTVTVVDTTPPSISCAADKSVECGTSWTFDAPTSLDSCGATHIHNLGTVTNHTCGNTLTATRTWNFTDDCGNTSVNCSQTVTVVDTTPPTITCVANKTVECGTAWTFDKPTALDGCGTNVISIVGTVTNATCGNTFTATRTWKATDDCGNVSANCSQTVTVVDTTAPTITCSPDLTNNCTSVNGAVVTFTVTATDVCGPNPTPVCIPASGSTFSVGVHTVDCVATDACGNSSGHCTFNVTVRDTAGAPTMTIVHSGSNVIISWPATCTTYNLEKATILPNWGASGATIILNGSTYYSTNAISGSAYYRLHKP